MKFQRHFGQKGAFSLIELLTVLAVVGLLTTLTVGGLGARQGAGLTTAGNKIANLAVLARQVAVSESTATAVAVLTRPDLVTPSGGAYRSVAVIKLEDNEWKQVSRWENLPEGFLIDPDSNVSTFFQNAAMPTGLTGTGAPLIKFQGTDLGLGDLACRIFLPGGGMLNPGQSAQLRVVEGEVSGATAKYRREDAPGVPANYYDLTLLGVTGQIKVARR